MEIGIAGCFGKMGSYITDLLLKHNYKIIAGFDKTNNQAPFFVTDDLDVFFKKRFDLVVDFTNKYIAFDIIKKALAKKVKVISGSTGLSEEDILALKELANKNNTSFILKPNFSLGINIIKQFLTANSNLFTTKKLSEVHHANKLDKPSGTALMLAKSAHIPPNEIEAYRIGQELGTHTIILADEGEEITITHKILSKEAYRKLFLEKVALIQQKNMIIEV